MGEIIRVYKVVSGNLTDMNGVNDYSGFPKLVVDSGNSGIHFSTNPIMVFTWSRIFSKKNTSNENVKYLVLEIDKDDIFLSLINEYPAVKKCRVVREMNIDDILDYFKSPNFKHEFCPKVALEYIKSHSQKYWLDLKENLCKFNEDIIDLFKCFEDVNTKC